MVKHFRDLRVYREAFSTAQQLFRLSKAWPIEERYALTDQIRRSSRSVCANIAEAWRKRRYEKHFVSKMSDADAEASETQSWLDFALACGYIERETYDRLDYEYEKIIGGLVKMMASPSSWCGPAHLVREEGLAYTPEDGTAHTPIHPHARTQP